MSRYFDDELIHSGVKGMKWKRHKYKAVRDANGKLHYIYDLTNKNKSNDQNTNHEIRSRKDIKPLDRFVATGAYDPNAHYEYTKEEQAFLDKERAEKIDKASKMVRYSGKYGPILQVYDQMKEGQKESKQREQQNREHAARSSEAANRAKAARKKQARDKEQSARTSESLARANAAKEKQAAAVAKEESRNKRQAQAEANKAQIERRKRMRQAEANKQQVERRKRIRQAEANADQIEARRKKRERESLEKAIKSAKERTAEQVARRKEHTLHEKKPTVSGSNNVTYWENAHVTSWRKKRR